MVVKSSSLDVVGIQSMSFINLIGCCHKLVLIVLNSERSKHRGRVFVSPSLYTTAEHVYFSSSAISSHCSSASKIVASLFSMRKTFASISIILLSITVLLNKGGCTGFSAKRGEVRLSVNFKGVLQPLSSDCTKDKSERVHKKAKKANLAIIYYQHTHIQI